MSEKKNRSRMTRVYQPGDYKVGEVVQLSPEAGQHVGVVLRMQPGDRIDLFPGNSQVFSTVIDCIHKKNVQVLVESVQTQNRESPLRIHLAQGISKGERMEIVVQKAVELGVAAITPIITARCALKRDDDWFAKKTRQWQAIAIAACEQCGRNQVPTVHLPISLTAFLQQPLSTDRYVLHPGGDLSWRSIQPQSGELTLLIGPEGGLSPDEMAALQQASFAALTLGPRVLRTETAAITALGVLQAALGDI